MTTATILPDLSKPSYEELVAQLAAKEAELASARKVRPLAMKVTAKGAVSIYGLQRFPVTLYKSQWERILESAESLRTFLTENAASLSTKA